MDEKLLEALIASLKKAGMTKDFLKLFKVTEESQIEDLVSPLRDSLAFPMDYETVAKLPNVRSEIDKQISKAIKTNTKKLKETYNLVKKDDLDQTLDDDEDEEDIASKGTGVSKAIQKQIDDLKALVEKQTKGQQTDKKKEEANRLLKENGIHEKFIKFFDLESEDTLEEQLESIKVDFEDMIKVPKKDNSFPFPKDTKGKFTDKELDEFEKAL